MLLLGRPVLARPRRPAPVDATASIELASASIATEVEGKAAGRAVVRAVPGFREAIWARFACDDGFGRGWESEGGNGGGLTVRAGTPRGSIARGNGRGTSQGRRTSYVTLPCPLSLWRTHLSSSRPRDGFGPHLRARQRHKSFRGCLCCARGTSNQTFLRTRPVSRTFS